MAKGKILKIPARGEWSFADADVDADGVFPLETLQGAVGGWIECVWLGEAGFPDLDMFVNEEGKLHVCRHDDANSVGLTDSDELALRRRLAELGF